MLRSVTQLLKHLPQRQESASTVQGWPSVSQCHVSPSNIREMSSQNILRNDRIRKWKMIMPDTQYPLSTLYTLKCPIVQVVQDMSEGCNYFETMCTREMRSPTLRAQHLLRDFPRHRQLRALPILQRTFCRGRCRPPLTALIAARRPRTVAMAVLAPGRLRSCGRPCARLIFQHRRHRIVQTTRRAPLMRAASL